MIRYPRNATPRTISVLLGLIFCASFLPAIANGANISTRNNWVKGEVDGEGRVIWWALQGPNGPYPISYSPGGSKSFLTVQIDGKYYTNNDVGPSIPAPPDFNLAAFSPTNTRLLSIANDGKDTIRTIWKIGDLDLIQDIYPFEFEKSGQIVIRVRVQNRGNVPATVAAQYLLDIDVDNDKAKVLTRWGYSPNWNQYQDPLNPPLNPVPWFYMGFKNPLPLGAEDESSTGYLENVDEGLMKPWRVTIGDWNRLVDYTWGPPTPLPNEPYEDDAILMEWPGTGVPSKNSNGTPGVVELARTSYGTGEFEICTGQLLTLSFYPHKLKCKGSGYDHNPFELESLVFNTNESNSATATKLTLHVTDPLTILGPAPVTNGGKDCQESAGNGSIQPLGVADLIWQVQAAFQTGCSADIDANLSLTAVAQGLNPPLLNECQMPITIECCDQDKVGPRFDQFQGSVFDSTFRVRDDSSTDKGLRDIAWNVSSGTPANFPVTINPPKPIADCPKTPYSVDVKQTDSTQGGCIDFTFTDCAGNTTHRTICFASHSVPSQPDTAKPVITQIGWYHWPTIREKLDSSKLCTAQVDTFRVTDVARFDKGLQKIFVAGTPVNMTFASLPFTPGTGTAGFSVAVVDSMFDGSMTVVAQDVAGHFDTARIGYCTTLDYNPPQISNSPLNNYSWHVTVTDSQAWDRGLAAVVISGITNVSVAPMPTNVVGLKKFEFDVTILDPAKDAGMCDSAIDLAGNVSAKFGNCLYYRGQTDVMRPNIVLTPVTPSSEKVDVNDIHSGFDYDTGIDSVWFTGVYNITLTDGTTTWVDDIAGRHDVFPVFRNSNVGGLHPFASTIPTFTISVTDTAATDSLACITIHTVDGRFVRDHDGVNETVRQWCYPITLDSLAPLISGTAPDRTHIRLHLSDDRLKDRGLRHLQMKSKLNFDDFSTSSPDVLMFGGDSVADVTLTVSQPGMSSLASLEALDMFGAKLTSPSGRLQHTSTADLSIYAQNLKMKATQLITQAGNFDVKVYLDSTDAVPLLQKQLGQYDFDFHLEGGNMIDFASIVTTGTLSNGWNVTATPGASRSFHVTGSAVPAGAVLSGTPGSTYASSPNALPLLILRFNGQESEYTSLTSVVIDGEADAQVMYNGGGLQRLFGTNSVVDVPKPYGTVNGGNIILKGFCSPVVGSGTMPSVIALERVTPSPADKASGARIQSEYTIPVTDGGTTHVVIELWNVVGEKIATLIDLDQQPGRYKVEVPTTDLAQGSYILRLVARDVVVSRRAIVR